MNDKSHRITDIKGIKLDSLEDNDSIHTVEESIMDPVDRMSFDEKKLLRKTWSIVGKNMKDVGGKIFEMIFSQSPDTKTLFPFTKAYTYGKHDKINTDIQFHGLRFMQIIESAIINIDHIKDLEPLLDNLGRRHGKLVEKSTFKTHHWATFVECTLYHFRHLISEDSSFSSHIDKTDRAMILWRILLRCIIKRMKTGLAQDLKNRKHHREYKFNTNLQNNLPGKRSPSIRGSKSSLSTEQNSFI